MQDFVTDVLEAVELIEADRKPNSNAEVRTFRSPNSGLSVSYSTKFFRMLAEDPPSVAPDVLVELESEDHFGARDPVLQRALRIVASGEDR